MHKTHYWLQVSCGLWCTTSAPGAPQLEEWKGPSFTRLDTSRLSASGTWNCLWVAWQGAGGPVALPLWVGGGREGQGEHPLLLWDRLPHDASSCESQSSELSRWAGSSISQHSSTIKAAWNPNVLSASLCQALCPTCPIKRTGWFPHWSTVPYRAVSHWTPAAGHFSRGARTRGPMLLLTPPPDTPAAPRRDC